MFFSCGSFFLFCLLFLSFIYGLFFIPKIIEGNLYLIDEIVTVTDEQAIETSKKMARKGFFTGISSGANVYASLKIAKKLKNKRIVTVLPDSADRYYSTELFE